jgi:hypothetical protein
MIEASPFVINAVLFVWSLQSLSSDRDRHDRSTTIALFVVAVVFQGLQALGPAARRFLAVLIQQVKPAVGANRKQRPKPGPGRPAQDAPDNGSRQRWY